MVPAVPRKQSSLH